MPPKRTIGKVSVKSEHDVEWKIDNIFSFTEENKRYYSPKFTLCNCEWRLSIYPNGREEGSAQSIHLYLQPSHEGSANRGVIFQCGVKKSDGTIDKSCGDSISWIFNGNEDAGYGYSSFLKRSQLVAEKTELAPSDTLTITCTLWKFRDFDSTTDTGSLSENLLDMLTSQTACDVTLHVRHKKFFAHKFILMARSPVFAAMFKTPMEENATGVVNIEDCDPEAFGDFLVYLYSGRLEQLSKHLLKLYKIADKYNVHELKSQCLVAMMGNLSIENLFHVVILAKKFQEHEIKLKCQQFFNENFNNIIRSEEWVGFLEQHPSLANKMLIAMSDEKK